MKRCRNCGREEPEEICTTCIRCGTLLIYGKQMPILREDIQELSVLEFPRGE
jgi:uncharacterized membrane protein YvbJ